MSISPSTQIAWSSWARSRVSPSVARRNPGTATSGIEASRTSSPETRLRPVCAKPRFVRNRAPAGSPGTKLSTRHAPSARRYSTAVSNSFEPMPRPRCSCATLSQSRPLPGVGTAHSKPAWACPTISPFSNATQSRRRSRRGGSSSSCTRPRSVSTWCGLSSSASRTTPPTSPRSSSRITAPAPRCPGRRAAGSRGCR